MELYRFQKKAVANLLGGKRICLMPVGTGKTAVMFRWLYSTEKKNIVIVTTASKARSGDMEKEAVLWNGQEWLDSLESFTVVSWHKFKRTLLSMSSSSIANSAFAFDEVQRSKGYTSGMGRAFLMACKNSDVWTGYTATPGDQWKDFISYFTATNLVKNKTDFLKRYALMQSFRGFPEIKAYLHEDQLMQMWEEISTAPDTSQMFRELPPESHHVEEFPPPREYAKVQKTRTKADGELIDSTMGLCHYLRQICFTKDKQEWLGDFIEGLGTNCIFFCNYVEEEETVCEIAKNRLPNGARIWRIDGKHREIPTPETIGKYDIVVAHYLSGGEALNLQFMNYWCSISPNYSYSTSIQARGRIKRIGQSRPMHFYYLKTTGTIEDDIYDCLKRKSDFSEKAWAQELDELLT